MPQIVRYSIPKSAYPRYEYSLRHHAGFIDRVLSLFKKLDVHTQVQSLKFSLPEIDVLRLSPSAPIVDEITIQQRPTEKVETNTKTIYTVESYLGETPLDEYDARLLVISIDEVPDKTDTFRKHLKNILFICQGSDTAISLKERIREEDDLIVTTKSELAKEIAFALERVVFRNIAKVVPTLRSMSEDVSVLCDLHGQLNDEAVKALKTCAYTPFLKALETEFMHGTFDYEEFLREKCSKHCIDNVSEQADITTPGYVRTTERIKVTVGNCIEYQIHKLSERLAHTMSQTTISIYKSIPAPIRDVLPGTAHPDPIQVQKSLYDEFFATLYMHIVPEEHSETSFETTEDLLRLLRSSKKDLICEIQRQTVNLPVVKALHDHMELIKDNRGEIADLVGEVRGMYSRSKVPQHERPLSPGLSKKKLSEKVAKALFENVHRIKGCGYRYNKLTIFLDKEPAEHELDEMTIQAKIKNILSRFGISEYDITPATKSVKHYRQVGAKIKAWKCGTLGGFAVMKQKAPMKDALCALVSMHVVNGARELMLIQNGDTVIQIGSMIPARGHHENEGDGDGLVDVAAAKILEDKVNMCDTSFKDSFGNNLPSRLHDNNDDVIILTGLKVHIYGATTPLGEGIITMSSYYDRNEQGVVEFITIEDFNVGEDGIKRFSKEGDSGAVICADDPDGECVHVISMLVGCLNYQDIEDDPTNKGKYITFRMTNALNKLERETGHRFELCQ